MLRLGLEELPLDVGGDGLLGKALILDLRLEIREVGLSFSQLGCGVQVFLLDLRAAELQQDRAGGDRLAGLDEASLDTSRVAGRDHDHGLGHKGADAAHLPHHLAALHDVGEDNSSVHARGGRLDARHRPGDGQERARCNGPGDDPPNALPLGVPWAWLVHALVGLLGPQCIRHSDFRYSAHRRIAG